MKDLREGLNNLSSEAMASDLHVRGQTVLNWEAGKFTVQSFNDVVDFFTNKGVKNVERYLLFNELRAEQLSAERRFQEYVDHTEKKALQIIRRIDRKVHDRVLTMLDGMALSFPAPRATLSTLRKKR